MWFIGVEVGKRRVHPLLKKILDPPLSSLCRWQVQDCLLLLSFFRSYELSLAKRRCLKSYELVKNYPGDWKATKCKFLTELKKELIPSDWRPTHQLT